jgi:hypothetical protein
MARYAVTELPDGDLILHDAAGDKRLIARRDRAQAMPAIALEASRYRTHWQPDMLQISYVIYRREDGADIAGPYLGQCVPLRDSNND